MTVPGGGDEPGGPIDVHKGLTRILLLDKRRKKKKKKKKKKRKEETSLFLSCLEGEHTSSRTAQRVSDGSSSLTTKLVSVQLDRDRERGRPE